MGIQGLPRTKYAALSREAFRKLALEHLRSEIWPLPRSPARWYFARFHLRVWWVDGRLSRTPYRPTVIAVMNVTNQYMLSVIPLKGPNPPVPSIEDAIGVLLRAMQSDYANNRDDHHSQGYRPRKIGFRDHSLVQIIGPSLNEVGVSVEPQEPIPAALKTVREFSAHVRRALRVDAPAHDAAGICGSGTSPDLLARVFTNVAHFIRSDVKNSPPNTIFAVRLLSNNEMKFFSVLREGDKCAGLAMYDTLRDWSAAWMQQTHNVGIGGKGIATLNHDIDLIPFDDIEALEQFGTQFRADENHRVPAFVEWPYAGCPARMEAPKFRRQLSIAAPPAEQLAWLEIALVAIHAALDRIARGQTPYSRTCTSVDSHYGKQKLFLGSFDSETIVEQLSALHQHDNLHDSQDELPLIEEHLHDVGFWQTLDARHGGLSRAAHLTQSVGLSSSPMSSPSPASPGNQSLESTGGAKPWGPFLYLPGQTTGPQNRAGSPVWHPKESGGGEAEIQTNLDNSQVKRHPRKKWERSYEELEASLGRCTVEDQDQEVAKMMRKYLSPNLQVDVGEFDNGFDDPLSPMSVGTPGSRKKLGRVNSRQGVRPKSTLTGASRGRSTPSPGGRHRGLPRATTPMSSLSSPAGNMGSPSEFPETHTAESVAANAAKLRRQKLLENHDGAMSDFLDGIGGECYRAGDEHEIPINERLGLMGPADRLGMSSYVEEGLSRLGMIELSPSKTGDDDKKKQKLKPHEQMIHVVEDQRCELWQGLWTVDYEKRWLPKILT